jgi:hypothetical protein
MAEQLGEESVLFRKLSDCNNFQEVINLNKLSVEEAGSYINAVIENSSDVTPTGLMLIIIIDQADTLVWEQKMFFIEQVIKPFMDGRGYRLQMYGYTSGSLNPDKNKSIRNQLKVKSKFKD